jgi:23S rRNA pseudouridine1911/1915/1917 synthase
MYSDFDAREWQERINSGLIFCNDHRVGSDHTLCQGDTLEYRRAPWTEPEVPDDIAVLLDATDLTVFAKPSGLPVLPGGGYYENTMLHKVRERFDSKLSPIHRLGRGTSGAILFTKNQDAASRLSAALRNQELRKTYLALVQGIPDKNEFSIDASIGRVPHPIVREIFAFNSSGKASLSHVRVLQRQVNQNKSIVEVTIPTGRPHQIRIHMAYAGFPLYGDPLYITGGVPIQTIDPKNTAVPGDCGYLLHSWKLGFPHSARDTNVEVVAPVPVELQIV